MATSMLNLVRYDLFRLTHTRMCRVYLAVFLALALSWGNGLSLPSLLSNYLVGLSLAVSMLTGHFFADDLTARFTKNILQAPGARIGYVLAAFAGTLVVTAVFALLGAVALALGQGIGAATAAGATGDAGAFAERLVGPFALFTAPQFWSWLLEVVMVVYVHACCALATALVTGSKALGVFVGMFAGWGFAELVFVNMVRSVGLRGVADWLEGQGALMFFDPFFTDGEVSWAVFPVVVSVALVVLFGALSVAVMRRRDVSGHAE